MSYISALRRNHEVLVWERTSKKRTLKKYPAPFFFYVSDSNGLERSIYNEKLSRRDFDNYDEMMDGKQRAFREGRKVFESDIPPELKVLSSHYYNQEAPALHATFLDIEVDYNPEVGFASPKNAYAPITAVALHHYWSGKSIVFAVPPDKWDSSQLDSSLLALSDVVMCEDEKELLLRFIAEIDDSDVLSGWNSDFFDLPYIYERLVRAFGKSQGAQLQQRLCFEHANPPKLREVEMFGVTSHTVDLSGRIKLDYMDLFKKYEMEQRASYKLESIADEILPDLPKLEYEGSLYKLYRENFNHFLRYNIRDTEILKGFEDKLGYVQLANVMVHISCAQFRHVLGTLALTDYAIVNYCHHELNVRVPDYEQSIEDRSIQGATVLEPKIGMHEFVGSIDINSLYPNSIRTVNISPETLIGQFSNNVLDWERIKDGTNDVITLSLDTGGTLEKPAVEWRKFLQQKKWAISGYGTVYDQAKPGIIPTILAGWFAKRKEFQRLKAQAAEKAAIAKQAKNKKEYNEWNDKATYYDKLQYVYKIKLNSAYGALSNFYFRFFDLRMGESVTGTGRSILAHQISEVGNILDGEYSTTSPSIVYGDTDSCYFETGADNIDDAIKIADFVAKKVNDSFKPFVQQAFLCNPGFDDVIKAGREVVTGRGIFVEKKRYVLHVLDQEGKRTDKVKIMGLDIKKTTIPKSVAKVLLSIIEDILKGKDWNEIDEHIVKYKEQLKNYNSVLDIGLPKGVKGVEDYTQEWKINKNTRLPGHVAASIHYNNCLQEYQDKESMTITSNMKIKVFYLKTKKGRFKSIALPTDTEFIPMWFKEHFESDIDTTAQIERLVDNPLENIFRAIGREVATKQSLIVNELLVF